MSNTVLQALLLGSLALSTSSAAPAPEPDSILDSAAGLSQRSLETRRFAVRAGLAVTDNHHTLSRVHRPPGTLRTVDLLRQNRKAGAGATGVGDPDDPEGVDGLDTELNQVEYLVRAAFGGGGGGGGNQEFAMVPDTGSSDTWVARDGFRCLDPSFGRPVNPENCGFGALFHGDFPGGPISGGDQQMHISYLSGDFLQGPMGYADVTVANVTVPRQQISLVDVASFDGDGVSSGILGLGLRGLTSAYRGPRHEKALYSPLVETMGASGAADPVVSFAMSRDKSRSYIAFGGVPPVETGEYTAVPIQKSELSNETDYLYYDVAVDEIRWWGGNSPAASPDDYGSDTKGQTAKNLPSMLVDSGTTINLLPKPVAEAINAAYSPPGRREGAMAFSVPCDAVPPALEIVIGGTAIRTHPTSMILPETEHGGRCLSGIGAGQDGSYILGDTFMQELVVVFDAAPERMQVKFAMRTDA